ncbi:MULTISPECIES: FUSC family protein [unclassified Knoellia]|uniref:FUSC family protein n=1 Tax=Knoellia altitudinis TaxID=3404795 RepID=UPI00361F1CA8
MPSASDLPARVAARSRTEARTRTDRLSGRLVFILQCGVGAALAWWLAKDVFDHPLPFFAPVTAIISLGLSYGQRVRRAVEVMVGVAIGVLIGDVFAHLFGSGILQLLVVIMLAMTIASLFGAGLLITIQAGVQAAIITTLVAAPGQAFTRWLDAVIGGGVALVISALAPATGLHRPRQQAARVVEEISAILTETAQVLRTGDTALAARTLERARASESMLDELQSLASEGVAVVRLSPFRRRHLPGAQAISDLLEPLDRSIRNLRVLVRRAAVGTRRHEVVPTAYVALLDDLARSCDDIARQLHERHEPIPARAGLRRLGERSAAIDPASGLSGEVIRAQVRSMVVDLLVLTGVPSDEAVGNVPVSDRLSEGDDEDESTPT